MSSRMHRNTVSVSLGCNCKTPKLLSSFFNPMPKPKLHTPRDKTVSSSSYYSPSDSTPPYQTNSTFSPYMTSSPSTSSNPSTVDGFGRVGPKSVAVEKESNDPYLDFRKSMVQMIVENEIYGKDELQELLNCFLQLNSPCLHGIIIRVFTEIWNSFSDFVSKPNNYYSRGF